MPSFPAVIAIFLFFPQYFFPTLLTTWLFNIWKLFPTAHTNLFSLWHNNLITDRAPCWIDKIQYFFYNLYFATFLSFKHLMLLILVSYCTTQNSVFAPFGFLPFHKKFLYKILRVGCTSAAPGQLE